MKPEPAHCAYCGDPFDDAHYGTRRTRDHVVPRSFQIVGAHNIRDGIVSACGRCNSLKANMMPDAIRATAQEHRHRADLLDAIAERTEELIAQRRLLP